MFTSQTLLKKVCLLIEVIHRQCDSSLTPQILYPRFDTLDLTPGMAGNNARINIVTSHRWCQI